MRRQGHGHDPDANGAMCVDLECRVKTQRKNWNQFTLTKSAAVLPVKVRYSRCTPVAPPAGTVTLVQLCQPPVGLTVTVATTGPVGLSRRYRMVPPVLAPDAIRVSTRVGGAAPKSTPS